jgi:signal transduction histidine kinase/predicted negative regulator of RcsB-dependent stress response
MRKIVVGLLFFSLCLSAQQKPAIDSMRAALVKLREDSTKVNAMNRLSLAYVKIDSVKGFSYARQALALSEKLQWQDGIAKSNFTIGKNYDANFSYGKAIDHFQKALGQTKNKRLLSKINTAIGGVYFNQAEYSKALASYHSALRIDEAANDKMGVAEVSMNIASIYYSIKNYPKAVSYINKSLDQKTEDQGFLAMLNRNIAVIYNNMGQTQKALDYFEKSLSFYQSTKDNPATASVLSDIALTYYDLEDYQKAIDYSKRALSVPVVGVPDKVNISFSFGIIGDSYIQKAKEQKNSAVLLDSAITYLNKAITLHRELDNIRGLYDDYTSLTEAQQLQGDFKKALETYQTSITYKDSIFNTENKETIRGIEDKRSIEIRDKELKISKLKLQAKERQKWFLIGGLALLGTIGCLLLYQNNSRRKANRKLNRMNASLDQANRVKTRLLGILNHDLRGPVNSFIHFIQLQKEAPELLNETMKRRIEDTTIASAKNLLGSMEDILLWTKNQMENFEPHPKEISVGSLFNYIRNHFSAAQNVDLDFEIVSPDEDLHLNTDEDYLKTILRNLTANAIEAVSEAQNPKVTWKAWAENGRVQLSVSDNGSGGNTAQFSALHDQSEVGNIRSGLGLHLIRDLTQAINCRIEVNSIPGSGTTFTLSFP